MGKIAHLLHPCLPPRSGKLLTYNGWPLLFRPSSVSVLENVVLSSKVQSLTREKSVRELLHQKGDRYNLPAYRLFIEIAQHINATAAAFFKDTPEPNTVIYPLLSLERYSRHDRYMVVGGVSANFLYCLDITLQDFSGVSFTSFSIPLDSLTWILLAAITCLSLLSAWTVGKVLWLPIFALLTNQSVEVKLKEGERVPLLSTFFIWLIVGSFLCSLYGSFIQSLLVVPEQ